MIRQILINELQYVINDNHKPTEISWLNVLCSCTCKFRSYHKVYKRDDIYHLLKISQSRYDGLAVHLKTMIIQIEGKEKGNICFY